MNINDKTKTSKYVAERSTNADTILDKTVFPGIAGLSKREQLEAKIKANADVVNKNDETKPVINLSK